MTRLRIYILAACACVAGPYPAGSQDRPATATARYGVLRLVGRQLCDAAGKPVQLRGVSTHGLQWYGWGKGITPKSLDVLATEWRADILRLSMYVDEGGYKKNPKHFRAMIDTLVDETLARGMYCIIDWHILDPGDPWANLAGAREFFSYMSAKHGRKKYVLYEICNEPNGAKATWARIKSYAEQIIPIIRKNDPDGIIIVGTPAWSSLGKSGRTGGRGILAAPLTGALAHHVMYSFHFYAGSHRADYRKHFNMFVGKLPLFVSEWGCQKHTGDGRNDVASSTEWMRLLDKHKISWCYWNYSDDQRSGAVWKRGTLPRGPFTDARLKESGRLVKKWIRREQ